MEVTRDVIVDLLPLYLAEEASPDTETLVREHLEKDSDLARLARQWKERLPGPPPAPVRPEAQVHAYHEAQKQLAWKTVALAVVITGGVLALLALTGLVFFHL